MAIVLVLSRSPSEPRLGLSGTGAAPGCPAKTDCRERAAVSRTPTNTQSTWNGRCGHRKTPLIRHPRAADPRLRNTHTLGVADPQRLTPSPRFESRTRLIVIRDPPRT